MNDNGVKNEGKPSNVKPYWHPHYQEYSNKNKNFNNNTIKEEDGIIHNI